MPGGVLITGGRGFIGSRLHDALVAEGIDVTSGRTGAAGRAAFETPGAAGDLVHRLRPRTIVHAGALSAIAECEADPARAHRINVAATTEIAQAARAIDARLIFLSTDQVWSGGEAAPYRGDEVADPLHVYGATKAAAEEAIRETGGRAVLLRLALVFGRSPSGRRSASEMILRAAEEGREVGLFRDEWRQPVSVGQVVDVLKALIDHDLEGTYALAGPESLTRFDFGQRVVSALAPRLDAARLRDVRASDLDLEPPRPADLRADGERLVRDLGLTMTSIDEELRREHPPR